MDSSKIIRSLKEKDFSSVLSDIQILISNGKKTMCPEICNILKALYQAVVPSSDGEKECAKSVVFDMIPCFNLCIDYAQANFSCSDLVKNEFFPILYHTIRVFLKVELHHSALSCASILKSFLTDPENGFADKSTYIKNMSIIFWNDALHFEKNKESGSISNFDVALTLRKVSVEFLLLDEAFIDSVNEKIHITLIRYCQNCANIDIEKLDDFLQSMWSHLEKRNDIYEHKVYLYEILRTWFDIMLKFLKGADNAIMKHFLMWFQNLSKSCKKKEHKLLSSCSNLSKTCIQFFIFQESDNKLKKNCPSIEEFCKYFKELNEVDAKILASTCAVIYSSFANFFRSLKNLEDKAQLMYLQSNLSSCSFLVCHFINLFSETSVQKQLALPAYLCFSASHSFINVLIILLKKEVNDTARKQLIKEAKNFLQFSFSKVRITTETDNIGKNIIAYASCIACVAMTLYGLGENWYSESVYFFEISDSIFSECSSFPEYYTDETQSTLWKLHELFVYVCFLTKCHERALEVIVKSLVIHQKKTKECFSLWRKVKRDAVHKGNTSVVSKTISDILLKMNLKIDTEQEIMYLVEEFEIYKSERCNLNNEVIALSQKILSMPCSNSTRAFILIQILTMPFNISEKITEVLKKSLSEICMEAVTLYKNVIVEYPEDDKAKLYLSVAYFWLYHNNIKKIHEIAKEEAQNLLKPPSPKPVSAVQNDVEEENDTCDIQPTHPLVSISFEAETLKYLNLAVHLWHDIPENHWEELSIIIKEENILDLIQATAEIFSSAVQECKEMEVWVLLRSVSIAVKNKHHELISGISIISLLVKLGYLNLASHFLTEIEKDRSLKSTEFENIEIKFKLSKSYFLLHMGKFDEGCQILQDILASPVLSKSFKSVKMLQTEALILLSDYLQLPSKSFSHSGNAHNLVMNSSLSVLMKSVSICKVLHKYLTEKEGTSNGYEWICFKPLLVKNLLKAHILLGELYFKYGDPRLSRCYLQEALKLAESHILTYWSFKILLDLAHVDFMCDNFKDCSVKANGLRYITNPNLKANCSEILNQLQNKHSFSNPDEPLSPDSPDGLIISTVPDIALTRQIKQTFIDKIDVMASPMPKRLIKDNSEKNLDQCNFNEENFSMNILQLESSLISYLLSKIEIDSKNSIDVLQLLISYFNKLRNFKCMNNILSSLKVRCNTEEAVSRFLTKSEVSLYVSVHLEKLEYFCVKNDILNAKETVKKAVNFLEKAHCPIFSFPDIYASLKYHDIRVALCEFYKISLNSSLAYYFCQSALPNMKQKKKNPSENSALIKTPNTPVNKNVPNIVISKYKSEARECRAPLKKNLLNTNMKRDLKIDISGQNSPYVIFSSSDEAENFESPFNSLSRASKTKSGPKISVKNDVTSKNSSIHYRIFTQKNSLKVKDASDVWSLCVTDTPKLGKENRKLRSSRRNASKSSQISKSKSTSATAASSKPKTRSKKAAVSSSILCENSNTSKFDEPFNKTDVMYNDSPERKMSIEYSRSSPHDKIHEKDPFPTCSSNQTLDPRNPADILSSDNVFYTPSKITPKTKISHLIDDLCKDLSSLSLIKSKVQHVAAGNLDEVIDELNELRLLIQNTMPYPLYNNICKLLGILYLVKRDGSWNEEKILESSFLLSETFSVSLRNVYIGNMIYFRENEYPKDKDVIIKTLKLFDCPIDDQMKSFLQVVPENWNVLQVTALHNQEYLSAADSIIPCPTKLIISHFQKNSTPIIISTDCSSDERFSSNFLAEFSKILEESYLTMLNNDSKSWWTTRSSLDTRMKDLTKDIENIWLGCWKGLFLGRPRNEERKNQLQAAVDAISKVAPCTKNKLLEILIDSAQYLPKEQVCAAVCYLWNCNHSNDTHKKLCKSIRQISIALPESERHPIILILDQSIQDLPWECMPILKGVPVTRMPSLSLLCTKLNMLESVSVLDRGFDPSKTYYVLNPSGDLAHSQKYFQQKFENQTSWKGAVGVAPCVKDYLSGLKEHELFIYCGHGSGRKYFEGTSIDKLKMQSTSILMGCSSGKLRRLGRILEAHGIVLRLLLSGCPSITANLWDVTDKDIDRFTDKLLQSVVPNYDDVECQLYDVAKAVSVARSACRMSYLVGAAPVVYGFPVFAMNQ